MGQEYTLLGLMSLEPGSWADWFSGSMSALAVVVALSAYPVSNWQKRRDERQREKEVGRAIGYKLVTLLSQNDDIDRHVKESLSSGRPMYPQGMRFSLVRPLGVPERRPRELNQNEIDLLLKSNSADLLMEMELCYGRYSSIVFAMNEYKARHEALYELLPSPIANEGSTFTHMLNEAERARAKPYMLMLESLLEGMEQLLNDNTKKLKLCLERFGKDTARYFGKPLMEFEPNETDLL